jgi:NADPH-dependent 2,4-dienoyl-CoA reductase/sulfur reductase-like enzyme
MKTNRIEQETKKTNQFSEPPASCRRASPREPLIVERGPGSDAGACRTVCDVLVVGGGINGAGIARDLAGRGLQVLLCEQDDLARTPRRRRPS